MEIIGNIGIIYTKNPEKQKKQIESLLKNKRIEAIFLHEKFEGEFRRRKLKLLQGKEIYETIHEENECLFKLDVRLFYATKLAKERIRIANLVQPGEKVCVFFCGVGPFPITISKHSQAELVVGVEKNPEAYRYFLENIKLNKCKNVIPVLGDVREFKWDGKFDRILMPLPWESEKFLDVALKYIKDGGIIHIYKFLDLNDFDNFKNSLEKYGKIENIKRLSSYAKTIKEFVFDLRINSNLQNE